MREQIIKRLEVVIWDFFDRVEARQYQSKHVNVADPHKTRQNYADKLCKLIHEYNALLKDVEINELQEEVAELKKEIIK